MHTFADPSPLPFQLPPFAEIATAEGQHKRSLKRPARRLSWNP